jgi:hypothetical protein
VARKTAEESGKHQDTAHLRVTAKYFSSRSKSLIDPAPSGSDAGHPQSDKFLWDFTYLCWNLAITED